MKNDRHGRIGLHESLDDAGSYGSVHECKRAIARAGVGAIFPVSRLERRNAVRGHRLRHDGIDSGALRTSSLDPSLRVEVWGLTMEYAGAGGV